MFERTVSTIVTPSGLPQEVLEREKWKINDFFSNGKTCHLPLDAAFHVKAVDVDVRSRTLHQSAGGGVA